MLLGEPGSAMYQSTGYVPSPENLAKFSPSEMSSVNNFELGNDITVIQINAYNL